MTELSEVISRRNPLGPGATSRPDRAATADVPTHADHGEEAA